LLIKSLSTNSGYLEDCRVEFAPSLTCVIGARGTCKSTLVETLRFVFGIGDERIRELTANPESVGEPSTPSRGLLRETLGAGSARCEVTDGQSSYVLERELDSPTRIYVDGVREHAGSEILHRIEIFSQGDLQRIADDNDGRLELIDRADRSLVERGRQERARHASKLQHVGLQLRTLRTEIAQLRAELAPYGHLQNQLQEAIRESPSLSPELDAERLAFEKRERVIAVASNAESLRDELLVDLKGLRSGPERFRAMLDLVRQQEQVGTTSIETILKALVERSGELLSIAEEIGTFDIAAAREELANTFERQNERFFSLRQQQQDANEALKKQTALRRQIDAMERRQQDLERLLSSESKLLIERSQLRAAIASIDDQLYQFRLTQIESINDSHGDMVLLALEDGGVSREYIDTLCSLLGGSRIRYQDDIAISIARTFSPSTLIDIIETGNAQRLAEVLGRDLGQMNRVVTYLADSPDLYRIEAEPPAVRLDITMFHDGEPKPVETLSKGQKATALLPLLLRPHASPLIIDQPEDDLDNKFIFRVLIAQLKKLKLERQVIFVTHNANIPVLGEADAVVVMSMRTPKRANSPQAGSVEERKADILDLLEGGAEAFRLRESSYGDLLEGI
jgi:hypothetical protein